MTHQISEKRYRQLQKYENFEKQWNKIMTGPNLKTTINFEQQKIGSQQREQKEQEHREELERINQEIDFEDELALASEYKEAQELLDDAFTRGEDYGSGYSDGFWAGRELQEKYRLARVESIKQKFSTLSRKNG